MPAADRKNSDLRAEIVKDKMYAEIFVKKIRTPIFVSVFVCFLLGIIRDGLPDYRYFLIAL